MTTTDPILSALNEIDIRRTRMPQQCPSWCLGQHMAALDEGCDVESARRHVSGDIAVGRRVSVQMEEDHFIGASAPVEIVLELNDREEGVAGGTPRYRFIRARLTTAEARSLAAALTHLADSEELHRWDSQR